MALSLILANNTTINLADASYTKHFIIECEDTSDFQNKWNLLTPQALENIYIFDNNEEVAHITGITLKGTQAVVNNNGTITGHFYFDGGQNLTSDYAQAGKILIGDDSE